MYIYICLPYNTINRFDLIPADILKVYQKKNIKRYFFVLNNLY